MSISQNFPEEGPTLNLNFAGSKTLDPRITFTRTSSATYTDDNGLIRVAPANSARFDHRYNPTTGEVESLGLLVEEQRTNLVLYSSNIDNLTYPFPPYWSKGPNTTQIGTTIAPDGTNNGVVYVGDGSGGNEFVTQTFNLLANTTYTCSIWAKLISGSVPTGGAIISAPYNNGTGVVRSVVNFNGKLTTEWQRFSTTFTNINAVSGVSMFFIVDQNNTAQIAIWGAQLEVGSFPTSYIPTAGTTATRTADNASITGSNFSSWYRQDEGTIICNAIMRELSPPQIETSLFNLKDGNESLSEQIRLNRNNNSGTIRFRYRVENVDEVVVSSINSVSVNNIIKTATTYTSGYQAMSVNGDLVTGSSLLVPKPDNLVIGRFRLGSDAVLLNGTITQLVYYPSRLSNNQLQTLTK